MPKSELILLLIWSFTTYPTTFGKLEKIAQLPSNVLVDFYAYRHISIIHFNVPEYTTAAVFKFTAKEEKISGLGSCSPRNVSIHLKSGSIPLVKPDGSKIAAKILKIRRHHYSLEVQSNSDQHLIRIVAPPTGDWFAIAFRWWTDPNSGRITQQGLGPSCDTIVDAELLVERTSKVMILDLEKNDEQIQLNNSSDSSIIQFLVSNNYKNTELAVSSSCGEDCKVGVHVTTLDHLTGVLVNSSDAIIPFKPYINNLHYITMNLLSGNASNITVSLLQSNTLSSKTVNFIDLTRKSLPDFFLFDYEHIPKNETKPAPLNLTVATLTVLRFGIGSIYDVGGTLTVSLKLKNDDKKEEGSMVIVGCLSLGEYSNISETGNCLKKNTKAAADLYVNKTGPSTIHIPFPEPGTWHLSLRGFLIEKLCNCSDFCLENACEKCSCMKESAARLETSIGSFPCIEGRCNSRGRCVHYMSGGFVFSACQCSGGYRGFDCSDDTYVLGRVGIMIRLLILTLSNLSFVGSIYLAIKREYYTESIVYTAVMFFSTFYHACEAGEDIYSFCIIRLNVLQFCDFYNALLSIWVTLVAMASFGKRLTAFCQILGAIVLAMSAEMDRTALWVFLLPALSGSLLIGISWGRKCRSRRTYRYPSTPYSNICLPSGLLLVILGLICYAFLQTRRNYYIIHSVWHICVAIGVMLLLPRRECMK